VVLELLGRGGMGEVYTAYDPELDRKVAVKVIHAALKESGNPEVAKNRLLREAQTMAKLSHPNVVPVFDVGSLTDDVYVAMEFIDGCDLREWCEAAERDCAEILERFIAAGAGLAAAHDAGLVHRDFKPENVLVGDDGRVRVIDFGIARGSTTEQLPPRLTRTDADALIERLTMDRKLSTSLDSGGGVLAGTPAYMAPEQFLGGGTDARTDQFAFCVALWEALAGDRPFPGKNIADLSAAVLDNERREMPADAGVPVRVTRALERGLAIEPDERFPEMRDLIAALEPPLPRASRRLLVGGASLAAAAVTAALVFGLTGGAKAVDPCTDVGGDAAAIWTSERRDAAAAALTASGDPSAATSWSRVAENLDRYAADWSAARRDVCEASRVRNEQSAEVAEKRIACLSERLAELRSLVGLLENANAAMVENAVESAAGLSRIEDCGNITRLAGLPDIPEALVSELAALKTFERAAQLEHGLAAARKALARSRELRSSAGEARSLYWLARLQDRAGQSNEAVDTYFEAVRVSDDVGDSRTEAAAWIEIVRAVGARLHRYSEADRWAGFARLAVRQDGSDIALEAELHNNLGWVRRAQGRNPEAFAEFRQAIRLHEKAFGAASVEALGAKAGAAAVLRDLERLDEAIEMQLEVLENRKRIYGDDHVVMTWAHASLATSLSEIGRYDEARAHFDRALELKRHHYGDRHPNVATSLANKGELLERVGDFEAAAGLYQESIDIHRERYGRRSPRVYATLEDLARIARKLGDMPLALRRQREAVRGLRELGADARPRLGSALTAMCDLSRRAGDATAASAACDEAIEILEADSPDPRDLATALTRGAHLDIAGRRTERAAERARRALGIRREHRSRTGDHAATLAVAARALADSGAAEAEVAPLIDELEELESQLHRGEDRYTDLVRQ
jgi:tetratricopeptide (TPR) repeat protein/predicted Ser/Thr protein kinase